MIFLELLQVKELLVVLILKLKHYGFNQFDLVSLSYISEEFKWLIEQLKDWNILLIEVVRSLLKLLDLEIYFPVHLFHTLDFSLLHFALVYASFVVIILLLGLDSEFTFSDLEDWHLFLTC